MIKSFGDQASEDLYHGRRTSRARKFPEGTVRVALRKLDMLHAARRLEDLRVPPGNRLENLGGDREGYCSIRVNDQWRVIFQWDGNDAYGVSVEDYH